MAVKIIEAYDRADEFPAFPPLQDWVHWRELGVWLFYLLAITQFATIRCYGWAIRTKPGTPYLEAREILRRRAARDRIIEVTLYRRWPPKSQADVAYLDKCNRKLTQLREERERAPRTTAKDVVRRTSLGV